MSPKGNEAFYMENGVKKDATIHDYMLDGIDPAEDEKQRAESARRAVEGGLDPGIAARIHGLPEGFDLDPSPKSLR
jgi:hypothetical protein